MAPRKAFNIPAIDNHFEALAIHLGVNTSDRKQEMTISKLGEVSKGIFKFSHNNAEYLVSHNSVSDRKSDKLVSFNSSHWSIFFL